MKIWITGYIGSGKSTIAARLNNVMEFDYIETFLKEKGYDLKNISDNEFKTIIKKELNKMGDCIIEGIQSCDYYTKGDKVYFVKTNFIKSMIRAYHRDGYNKLFNHLWDNIKLFFKLKKFYLKVLHNNDIITDIDNMNR